MCLRFQWVCYPFSHLLSKPDELGYMISLVRNLGLKNVSEHEQGSKDSELNFNSKSIRFENSSLSTSKFLVQTTQKCTLKEVWFQSCSFTYLLSRTSVPGDDVATVAVHCRSICWHAQVHHGPGWNRMKGTATEGLQRALLWASSSPLTMLCAVDVGWVT